MSTVAQILDWVDRYYPHDISDANMIIDLDQLHKQVFNKLIRHQNIFKYETGYTVADQLTYSLPTACKPENIIKISVSSDLTGSIDADTTWQEYEFATQDRNIDSGYYWRLLTPTTIIISVDGEAIDTTDYEIRYFFWQDPTSLTAVTDTPDLDAEYHDILKFGLVQMVASQGQNPDTEIADYYQRKFDERMKEIIGLLKERYDNAPIELEQLGMRW